jgi:hypothetical protein
MKFRRVKERMGTSFLPVFLGPPQERQTITVVTLEAYARSKRFVIGAERMRLAVFDASARASEIKDAGKRAMILRSNQIDTYIKESSMAEKSPQSFSHHARYDPPFHFFVLPVFGITLLATIYRLVRHPSVHCAWLVVIAAAALLAIVRIRMNALKVQDRVIRLEERLRLAALLDPTLRPRIAELTESQLIALRFASDAELPALAVRAMNEKLANRDIKQAIQHWRPDEWRV